MVRSLVIRQIFRILDVILVIAVIVAGSFSVKQIFTAMPVIEVDEALLTIESVETANLVCVPGSRVDYELLVGNALFGPAGKWDPDAAPLAPQINPEDDIDPDIADTDLDLQLKGTIALEPGDPFSTAFIENLENREPPKSFLIGQEIVENVILELVYKREVILLNKRSDPPQQERLRMEDAEENTPLPGGRSRIAAIRPTASHP
ncbi:MAG: hypothetical protein KAH38_00715, partial [Candidatus Hydrogenedentes bacterium]|nr:hypothetical protein [Candidatus Hydrogenedentota bacterium]